jgi:transposase
MAIVNDLALGLTDQHGIGPVSAAQVIVSFSHPGRCRPDAAFAALAGVSPLQASSGRTVRHRDWIAAIKPVDSAAVGHEDRVGTTRPTERRESSG